MCSKQRTRTRLTSHILIFENQDCGRLHKALPTFPLAVTYVPVCPTPNLLNNFAALLFKAGRKHPAAQWDRKEIEGGYLLPLWPPALNGAFLSTTAAGQRLDPLDLFARLPVEDGVSKVDVPIQACVRVVLLFSGWLRVGCARLWCVHEAPPRGPGPGGCLRAGPSLCYELIVSSFVVKCNNNQV